MNYADEVIETAKSSMNVTPDMEKLLRTNDTEIR